MTKNYIPNPKLIDPNDNQPFYIRILRFFLSFFDFDPKILVFQLQKERSQKPSFLGPNPHYFRIFSWKVDARVIVITFMQKFGEKSV